MKKLFVYIQALVLPLLVACSEDNGNYDYAAINDVTISGVDESYTLINNIDRLEISPVITTAMSDDSHLTYEWKVQRENSPADGYREVVGTDRELNWDVELPNTGDWVLMFRVTDTETGVVTVASADLEITTRIGKGIALIGETPEGKARVDYISIASDTLLMPDIMAEVTDFDVNNKPVNICHAGRGYSKYLWVMTEKNAWRLNSDFSIVEGSSFKDNAFVVDDSYNVGEFHVIDFYPHQDRGNSKFGFGASPIAICSNGLLFNGTTGFVDPINILSGEKEISYAKPYVLSSNLYTSQFSNAIFYDETHERFLYISSSLFGVSIARMNENEGDLFPWDNKEVGRTLQFAQNSTNTDGGATYGNSFALMRDKSNGDYYIYKFYPYSRIKIANYEIGRIAPDLDNADFYVFSSVRTVLYYTIGSKLYGLDYNPGNERVELIKDFGTDEITLIKVDDQIELGSDYIYVATYNPTDGGTLVKLEQGTNPDVMELKEVKGSKWTDLCKVKGMTWKDN
ncbi:MAG: hypothetical protein IJ494_00740 [Bacteroides sp.]|nr:hypothetical protein [Bacteroides sp.]